MPTDKKRSDKNSAAADRTHAPKTITRLKDGTVRVWSEVGVTLPVADFTSLRFAFGHERISKNDSQEELKRTAAQIDEFNEAELERRIRQYQRLIRRVSDENDEDDPLDYGKHTERGRKSARRR